MRPSFRVPCLPEASQDWFALNLRALNLKALGALLAFVIVLSASSASAFRPSSRWVVDQAVKYRLALGIQALLVQADVDRYDIEGQPPVSGSGSILILQPRSMRREIPRADGVDVSIVTPKRTLIEVGGNQKKQRTRPDVLVDFMTIGNRIDRRVATDRMLAAMKAIGINDDVVSYGRFDGRVAYVIGSKSYETDKPQIWFDKNSLRLLRVVHFVTGVDKKKHRVDLQLTGYGSPEAANWWPKRMTSYRDGKLQQVWVTRRAEKLSSVEEDAFTIK